MSEVAEGEQGEVRSRRSRRPILLVLLAVILAILLALWTQRGPIASGFIDRELARRGVEARYKVEKIGFGTQRLTQLSIGDPARPDLVARSVELRLGWSLGGPKILSIKARGVRLRGRLTGDRLNLGQVDRLLPPPSGTPFRLPDQNVDIADSGLRLETEWGALSIGVEGRGRLSDGFRGNLAIVSARISPGTCRLESLRATLSLSIDRRRPHFAGPVGAQGLDCGAAVSAGPSRIDLDATLAPELDSWTGSAALDLARLVAPGAAGRQVQGRIGFAGNASQTSGRLALAGRDVRTGGSSAARLSVEGPYAFAAASRRITFAGQVDAQGARVDPAIERRIVDALGGLAGSPIAPLASQWSAAIARAGRDMDAHAAVHLSERGEGVLRVDRLDARSRSGARISLSGGKGFEYAWPGGRTRIDGRLALAGGGLPNASFSLRQDRPGGGISGTGHIAPLAAGPVRLTLGEIRFAQAGSGTFVQSLLRFDGPLGGGRVSGLEIPVRARIDGKGGFRINESCTTIALDAFTTGTLRLGPSRLPLCPTGGSLVWKGRSGKIAGGASVSGLRLAGRLGSSPIAIAADRFRFALADQSFAAAGLAVRLGQPESVSRLDLLSVTGRVQRDGLKGSFSGLKGKLAAVPLRVSEGKGDWRLRGTSLSLDGGLTLSDDMVPPRFYPLVSRDFTLRLADNRIEAGGALADPKTGTHIADARISHDLSAAKGRALIDIPGIKFDPAYQPEQLTRLTVGVIALVNGVVKGQGEIAWDGRSTTSSGTFSTENMNLAANFGPVEGLSTRIHFTDLLGLVTAPGQIATTKLIRTGVDVFDGQIRYRILPDLKAEVEEGRWPFAGGDLRLDRTILDFTRPAPKRLTFRLTGMDASRFVSQMEFSNINATGTFDGVVPMIFDDRGGRIEGGHLVARDPGGTLSYVGELTDKDLGVYGKLAFDALKSLRYSKLIVDLNGSLEGEFIAGIQLDGIARNVAAAPAPKGGVSAMVVGRALGQLAKIPFKFNISVRGPFRTVIATARSLQDPTDLIQSVLPRMLREKPPVQPKESEPVR